MLRVITLETCGHKSTSTNLETFIKHNVSKIICMTQSISVMGMDIFYFTTIVYEDRSENNELK